MLEEERRPDFFIIGAPKCGTSALAFYLSQHPNVYFSSPKEPFFWCSEFADFRSRHRINTLQDYLALFREARPSHLAVGEGSTTYLFSNDAVPRILEFRPDARFVVMLRNPVDVCHALHSELYNSHLEDTADFEAAWEKQKDRRMLRCIPSGCDVVPLLQYGSIAEFSSQIKRLFDSVPEKQRHVIIFDDFQHDVSAVYEQALQFLRLPSDGRTEFPRVNESWSFRSKWLSQFILDPPLLLKHPINWMRNLARRHQTGLIPWLKRQLRRPAKRPPLRPAFEARLNAHFSNDVAQLSQLLKRDLTHWTKP